jgi:hypothetical protein
VSYPFSCTHSIWWPHLSDNMQRREVRLLSEATEATAAADEESGGESSLKTTGRGEEETAGTGEDKLK